MPLFFLKLNDPLGNPNDTGHGENGKQGVGSHHLGGIFGGDVVQLREHGHCGGRGHGADNGGKLDPLGTKSHKTHDKTDQKREGDQLHHSVIIDLSGAKDLLE